MPRPPEIITSAAVNSGLSDSVNSADTNIDFSNGFTTVQVSISAELPSLAASNAAVLTVITLILSEDCTVAIALPAYIGLKKVSTLSTFMMSEIWATSNKAATLGIKFFPVVVAAANTWLASLPSSVTSSAIFSAIC